MCCVKSDTRALQAPLSAVAGDDTPACRVGCELGAAALPSLGSQDPGDPCDGVQEGQAWWLAKRSILSPHEKSRIQGVGTVSHNARGTGWDQVGKCPR